MLYPSHENPEENVHAEELLRNLVAVLGLCHEVRRHDETRRAMMDMINASSGERLAPPDMLFAMKRTGVGGVRHVAMGRYEPPHLGHGTGPYFIDERRIVEEPTALPFVAERIVIAGIQLAAVAPDGVTAREYIPRDHADPEYGWDDIWLVPRDEHTK